MLTTLSTILLAVAVLAMALLFFMIHRANRLARAFAQKIASQKGLFPKVRFPVDSLVQHNEEVVALLLKFLDKIPALRQLKLARRIVKGFRFTQPITEFAQAKKSKNIDEALLVEWASIQLVDFIFIKLRMTVAFGSIPVLALLVLLRVLSTKI